jgi:hypothetical protein
MIRVVVENIVLFLLPAAVYFAFRFLTMSEDRSAAKVLDGAPYIGLFAAGAVLVVLVLAVFAEDTGGKPGQKYVPPVLKGGKIEPGHHE